MVPFMAAPAVTSAWAEPLYVRFTASGAVVTVASVFSVKVKVKVFADVIVFSLI